jgi:hypothetical protein
MNSGCEFLERGWYDKLQGYLRHRNDEHLEALVLEVRDFFGDRIHGQLPQCSPWMSSTDALKAGAMLYLIDRGVVKRCLCDKSGIFFRPDDLAEFWVLSRPELLPVAMPLLELIACLRRDCSKIPKTSSPSDF